jgi:hypothetical protein
MLNKSAPDNNKCLSFAENAIETLQRIICHKHQQPLIVVIQRSMRLSQNTVGNFGVYIILHSGYHKVNSNQWSVKEVQQKALCFWQTYAVLHISTTQQSVSFAT